MTTATPIAPRAVSLTHAEQPQTTPLYRCACGHSLRVSGLGRHRIYFELSDERLDDPVMNGVCPACQRGLPGKNQPDAGR